MRYLGTLSSLGTEEENGKIPSPTVQPAKSHCHLEDYLSRVPAQTNVSPPTTIQMELRYLPRYLGIHPPDCVGGT